MIRVKDIKIRVDLDNATMQMKKIAKILKVQSQDIKQIKIKKKSIDARNKKEVFFVYDFLVTIKNEDAILKRVNNSQVSSYKESIYQNPKPGNLPLKEKIVVVGMGPAGLFAAYTLLENGYKPIIIEQGKKIEERILDVENFWQRNLLNPLSNVQFGEGGAGTFSDGKLNTLVKDKDNLILKIFETFVKFGANEKILYEANPHIGTDVLRTVIKRMRDAILAMGGEIFYQTKLTDLVIKNHQLEGIIVNNHDLIKTNNVILAIGNSSRDTFKMLYERKIEMEAKPFAVGVRVMHPQALINKNQYGDFAIFLEPANYKLTYTTEKGRGVYSFCMCPGGYVVNSSSEANHLVVNGMSNYLRESLVANSALVVTVSKNDFGSNPLDGLKFQEAMEAKAYQIGDGQIPLQLYKDFKESKESTSLGTLEPVLKGHYKLANLREALPAFVAEALLEAIPKFGQKIIGFDNEDILLAGVETRTSSPLRIKRDANYEANLKGLFPCGEGAGYAGGITTSAMDGLRIARLLIERYKA